MYKCGFIGGLSLRDTRKDSLLVGLNVTSQVILFQAMVDLNFERNGTDKFNSISENVTKLKVGFDFYGVSDIPQRQFRVHLCTYITEKNLGCCSWSMCAK